MSDQPSARRSETDEAEDRFLDAVLRERYRSRAAEVDRAVTRAMSRLSAAAPLERRGWAPWSAAAAAVAALVFVLVFVGPDSGAPDARAMIDRALRSALDDVDRRYRVVVDDSRSAAGMELGLDVRGGHCFRVEVLDGSRAGGQFGSDGADFWLIPHLPMLPAMQGDLPPLREWLERGGVELPLLQVSKVLERLGEGYDLEVEGEGAGRHRVEATLRDGARGPRSIDLVVRESDGAVVSIDMRWQGDAEDGVASRGRMKVELQEERPQQADWYDVRTHCGQRAVVGFPDTRGGRR